MTALKKFDIRFEALLEIPCNLRLCWKLFMRLALMYFFLSDDAFDSMDSQEDFPSVVIRVGFVLTCKAVQHTRVGYATLKLQLSDDPLFPLLFLLELELSCRMDGKNILDLDSSFVAMHWSLYCCGLVSKILCFNWWHCLDAKRLVAQSFYISLGIPLAKVSILNCSLHGETPNLLLHSVCLGGMRQ